ncbi:hypothetical protein RUND412_009615 [Rhizina undulata]
MAASGPFYSWLDGVEDLKGYSKGGYYPITISDILRNPRTSYLVLKSWVTAAIQQSNELAFMGHFAVDVAPGFGCSASAAPSKHPASQYLLPLLDSFQVESPNGTHTCLVMKPQGPCIFDLRYESKGNRLPGRVARIIAPQLADAVAYLHSHGIVHRPWRFASPTPPREYVADLIDLHTKNILLRVPSLSTWTPEKVTVRLGAPVMKPVERLDGGSPSPSAPVTVIRPCHPRLLIPFCFKDPKICVIDFGEAFFAADQNPKRELHTALSVVVSEILLEDWNKVGPQSDIWTLTCTIFEILGDHRLFEAVFNDPGEVLQEIVAALNGADNPPESWRSKFPEKEEPARCLKERVAGLIRSKVEGDRFEDVELEALLGLLEKMLKYDPRDRMPAADVAEGLPPQW